MGVLPRNCRAFVPDNLTREHVRETRRFEHRHGTMAQTVERNLAYLARSGASLAGAVGLFPVAPRLRLNKSSFNKNFPKLIRQRARAFHSRCVREDRSVRVIARRKR